MVNKALLELVQAAADACGSAQPAQVGTAFKELHGQTFDERRKDLKVQRKLPLARYIDELEIPSACGLSVDLTLLELVRAAIDNCAVVLWHLHV